MRQNAARPDRLQAAQRLLQRRAAFTLIELLVVITIIALLIGMIAIGGSAVMYRQKVAFTESIMKGTLMAIDHFAADNPLRQVYDAKGKETFGPYPPYQLHDWVYNVQPGTVNQTLDQENWGAQNAPRLPYTLANRLLRDLSNGKPGDFVSLAKADPNDDNRALYTYLKVYAPTALAQVPEKAVKPLGAINEYVNPTGTGTDPKDSRVVGLVDVLGIHDAWDVPLDYCLVVKLEYAPDPANPSQGKWRVAERVPVLRSRGLTREEIDGGKRDADKWIFSSQFPSPAAMQGDAAFRTTGGLSPNSNQGRNNGWARALGQDDLDEKDQNAIYGYVP